MTEGAAVAGSRRIYRWTAASFPGGTGACARIAGSIGAQIVSRLQWGPSQVVTLTGDTIVVDTATPTARSPASPIIYLAGGPGCSALGEVRNADRLPLFEALRGE